DLRENLAVADREGTESPVRRGSPNDVGATPLPLNIKFFRRDSILIWPAVEGPVGRTRQSSLQEEKKAQNQARRSNHPHHGTPRFSVKQKNIQPCYFHSS